MLGKIKAEILDNYGFQENECNKLQWTNLFSHKK